MNIVKGLDELYSVLELMCKTVYFSDLLITTVYCSGYLFTTVGPISDSMVFDRWSRKYDREGRSAE